MTRIYANPRFSTRMAAYLAVIVVAILFGFWELWSALRPNPEGAGYGLVFAALFIGGGLYGLRQMHTDHSNTVTALDLGTDGGARITVWRLFRSNQIEGPVDLLGGWRKAERGTGSARVSLILADHRDEQRPLRFELGSPIVITPEFRALAQMDIGIDA